MLDELSGAAHALSLSCGDVLVGEGDEADEVFFVRSGRLNAVTSGPSGELLLGVVEPGELIGEIALVTGRRRMATLRASEPSVVFRIARSAFEEWMIRQPEDANAVALAARERIDRARVAAMIETLIGSGDTTCVQDMLDLMEWRRLEAGTVLFRENEPSDAAYFIVSGRLVATNTEPDGRERRLSEMGNGDIVGELGLIDHAPRAATVRAVRDTTLARFSGESFERLIAQHPGLALHVARSALRRTIRPGTKTRASSIAVAITAQVDPEPFMEQLLSEMSRFGTTFHFSSERVGALLKDPYISQLGVDNIGVPRLSEFLHQADVENDHVIYRADPGPDVTTWSRRCLRHADRVILVMSAEPDEAEDRHLRALIDELRRTEGVSWWLAVLHASGTQHPTGSAALLVRYGADEIVHLRSGFRADIARLARLSIGRGFGLVLSGGGARGFAHIGVVRALRELGIPIDMVGGSSIGSPIGACVAMDVKQDELLETVSRQFHRLLDYTIPVVSVLKGARIAKTIETVLGGRDIEDLWLGFFCVSTNLTASRLEIHRRGALALAVRASVAIPGVLPPVPLGGDLLVDGGVLANLPVQPMRDHVGIGTVIAVNAAPAKGPRARVDYGPSVSGWRALWSSLSRRRSPYPSLSAVLLRTMIVGSLRDQPAMDDPSRDDLCIEIDVKGVSLLAFEQVKPVAEAGYVIARPVLDAWLATSSSDPASPKTHATAAAPAVAEPSAFAERSAVAEPLAASGKMV